jgi:predicted membrane protein
MEIMILLLHNCNRYAEEIKMGEIKMMGLLVWGMLCAGLAVVHVSGSCFNAWESLWWLDCAT